MTSVKEELLKTNLFQDNAYLDKYIQLISNTPQNVNGLATHKHHIIPYHILRKQNISIYNKNYLVNLLISDHIKAHYFLFKCSKTPKEKYANIDALNILLNAHLSKQELDGLSEQDLALIAEARNCLESELAYISGAKNKGKRYLHKDNIQRKAYPEEIPTLLQEGWALGGLPFTEAHKQKLRKKKPMSEAAKQRLKGRGAGLLVVNKDNIFKRIKPEDLTSYLAEGWRQGGIACSQEKKQKLSKLFKGRAMSDCQRKQLSMANTGYKIMQKDNIEAHVRLADVQKYIELGWELGRPKSSLAKYKKEIKEI